MYLFIHRHTIAGARGMHDLNVLLLVSVPHASPWQRKKLEQEMTALHWSPMEIDGWFSARFLSCESDTDVLDTTDTQLYLIAERTSAQRSESNVPHQ